MQIRDARPDDATELARQMAVAAEEGWIGTQPPVDVEERAERFRKTIESDEDFVYVVEQNGAIVGHGALTTTRAKGVYSFGILVTKEARGHGSGRKLLERLIDQARDSGAHKLELEVWPDNARAIALYASMGFEFEGVKRNHYRRNDGSLRSSVLMALPLSG
jgi:RimJ/RimL family protein N-acetyltransferase